MSQTKKNSFTDSMLFKGIIIAILTLLLLIPIHMVTSLIEERAEYKEEVTSEIVSKWGGEQNIKGPVLVIPYTKYTLTKIASANSSRGEDVYQGYVDYIYLMPDLYNTTTSTKVEERSRSIYSTLVYQSISDISGNFDISRVESLKIPPTDIHWHDAFVIMGVSHMQGIKNKVVLNINGKDYEAMPGVTTNTLVNSGLTVKLPIDNPDTVERYDFKLALNLNGSEKLQIAPIGKENNIKMNSDWNIVSLSGDFLATKRDITAEGVDAEWNIFDYNRNYEQIWMGENYSDIPLVGIDLRYNVDQYQMNMRSVKYAIMFIVLTFVVFLFVEIITKRKIHPVQYTLVSLALILFYTLLIALSEHINFHLSYLVASVAIVLMITFYVKSIFKKWSYTLGMGAFIATIYTYLYVILQLEDMSLLIGAIGLFIILAVIMYASRKIDWYKRDNTSPESMND